MSLHFTDPRWDLVLLAAGLAGVLLVPSWPWVLGSGLTSVVLLKVRLARADAALRFGRGSKLNHVFTWILGVNALSVALWRSQG